MKKQTYLRFLWLLLLVVSAAAIATTQTGRNAVHAKNTEKRAVTVQETFERATFAGGCFWCMEKAFEKLDGVVEVISGYTGGRRENPTYEDVSSGRTGHREAVQITYDPRVITYPELLDVFWKQIDPTDTDGQFVDRGPQYRTAIFYHSEEQNALARQSKNYLAQSGRYKKPLVTDIIEATTFYEAEAYHQDYYRRNPIGYSFYRSRSGRDRFLEEVWSGRTRPPQRDEGRRSYVGMSEKELKEKLTPLQYHVTRENGTEPAFDNEYWNNKREGIYVDIVSGEPLFSSLDKYESGTGWPSFTRPMEPDNIVEKEDRSLFMVRREVRSRIGNSHLGHVFTDGPPPTGLRYCMNSAALRFILREDLENEGYGEYEGLFQ